MIRLFTQSPLAQDARLTPDEKQAHYLRHVMRAADGDSLLLFNGCDGEWRARLSHSGKHGAALTCLENTRPQTNPPPLRLFFAPIKRGHGDMVIEKATELGATRLSPILTQHTIVTRIPLDRYRAIAIEAAEQCERLAVPEIDPPQKLDECLATLPPGEKLILCAEQGEAQPLAEIARNWGHAPAAILVGPEGGFSRDEFAQFAAHKGMVAVHLGPQILRADTAAIAALALFQAASGRWNARMGV